MNFSEHEMYVNNCKQCVDKFLSNLKNVSYQIKEAYTRQIFEGFKPSCYVDVDFSYNNFDVRLKVECDFEDNKIVINSIREIDAFLSITNNQKSEFFCSYDNFNEKNLMNYINFEKEKHIKFIERHKYDLCCD